MEAAGLTRPQRTRRIERPQLALLAALLALAAVAWVLTDDRMAGMDSSPGAALGSLGFYVTVWVVMMAAMMFPSVAPTVLMYESLREGHRAAGRGATPDATAIFVAGYLLVWTAAGLFAYGLIVAGRELDPAFLAWDEAGRWVTGGMMFLAERWRSGRAGALELGARHGAWCLGCCWALMAALFAVGIMSLGWMAVIAAFIAGEKLLPWPKASRYAVAVALLALGLAVSLVPADVPGFAEPTGQAMHDGGMQMQMMR
jgi:predicted metal-binding membrane protein